MKTDRRVDAYIAKSGEFARPILSHLRKRVHAACPQAEETIRWNMPFFTYGGALLCAMAAFKAHCAFLFWHQRMKEVLAADGARKTGAMGSLGRITKLGDLPDGRTMTRYLKAAAKLNESGEPARASRPRKPKSAVRVPSDLAAALKKNRAAAKAFANFSYSHRKEYVEWITGAKRDETRRQRLATAIDWLAQGKPQNWRYLER
jgi:uncharacterized protein YdeI (YjbR/CyaY-like superfamily)